ncbi:Component of the microtubule-nucleating Tub4p (gamma-tubulin) complex [Komagataella phaffii GS115]|uniref:Spindle pole body component n=2 Tax=Komagataella phaffii TaxID=460519 RepID=C4R0H5_KOMPG|nr:Component of the microtubule-nucleating Tub4p (gamma-tubulin) complex [Komagataella phaffii GS115]CAY68999.1 Component of the microtubule-nucleating Tub4p (gamma-tubulin) complex [Komagataella phaffii GS115]
MSFSRLRNSSQSRFFRSGNQADARYCIVSVFTSRPSINMTQMYDVVKLVDQETKRIIPTTVNLTTAVNTKPYPLQDLSDLKEQEAFVVRDILYCLQGNEGDYVRFSKNFNEQDLRSILEGPDYRIAKNLDVTLKDMTNRLLKYGKMYYSLTKFVEVYDSQFYGATMQRLCNEIRDFLKEHDQIVLELERRFMMDPHFSIGILNQLIEESGEKMRTLYEIITSLNEVNRSNLATVDDVFKTMLKTIKEDLKHDDSLYMQTELNNKTRIIKGGIILRIVQDKMERIRGDQTRFEALKKTFDRISLPYIEMLHKWLTFGKIDDPFDEFFIVEQSSKNTLINYDSKFLLRKNYIIRQFEHRELQRKVLLTGKYLDVLRCLPVDIVENDTSNHKIESLETDDLFFYVEQKYLRANKLVTELFMKGYKFLTILEALKSTLLFSNGVFLNDFLAHSMSDMLRDKSKASLSKIERNFEKTFRPQLMATPRSKLVGNLVNINVQSDNLYTFLESILNIQQIDAEEVFNSSDLNSLKRYLNKTLTKNTAEVVISPLDNYLVYYLSLNIEFPFPLNLLLTNTIITQFQLVGRNVMITNVVEKLLESSWKEINYQRFWCFNFPNRSIRKWILRLRYLHSNIKQFVSAFHLYLSFDVIEGSFSEMETQYQHFASTADSDFEKYFVSLQKWLNTMMQNSLLMNETLVQISRRMFEFVLTFHTFVMSLRKNLILLDENLFDQYASKLGEKQFDPEKNRERVIKMKHIINEYEKKFESSLNTFVQALNYYSRLESSSFSVLAGYLDSILKNRK